jgi:hypothetical protein
MWSFLFRQGEMQGVVSHTFIGCQLGREHEFTVHATFEEKGCRWLEVTCLDDNASVKTLLHAVA